MADKAQEAFEKMVELLEGSISEKVNAHISALRVDLELKGNNDFGNILIRKVVGKSVARHFPVTTDKLQKATEG